LDNGFHAVTESSNYAKPEKGFARVSSKATGRIRHISASRFINNPTAKLLELLLTPRKVSNLGCLAIGYNNVGLPSNNWLNQVANSFLRVLVVAIGINHNISAHRQGRINAIMKSSGQTHALFMSHKMFDTEFFSNGHGVVSATIVNDKHDNLIDPRYLLWDSAKNRLDGLLFIKAWYLYN
jgi:hypothetical protein